MDERGHLLERLLGDWRGGIAQQPFTLALEDRHLDLASSLPILADELVEIRARMRLLVRAREAQHGRRCRPFPTGQDARGRPSAMASSVRQYWSCMGTTRSASPAGGVQSCRRPLA